MSNPFADLIKKRQEQELALHAKYGNGFGLSAQTFKLNVAEVAVINEWLESLKPEILAIQKGDTLQLENGEPYYGAIGGGVTYSFAPTGLGNIITVKELTTGKELNVSAALDWYFFG